MYSVSYMYVGLQYFTVAISCFDFAAKITELYLVTISLSAIDLECAYPYMSFRTSKNNYICLFFVMFCFEELPGKSVTHVHVLYTV